jgi:hypothetical protein
MECYTSADGTTWTLANSNVMTPTQTWENGGVFQLGVAGQDSNRTWWGYYSGNVTSSYGWGCGQASSTDLIHWTKTTLSAPYAAFSNGTFTTGGTWIGSGNFTFLKVGSTYYGWSQTTMNETPGFNAQYGLPSDIMRWSATSPAGPWTALGSLTYYRNLPNEGMTTGATAATSLGQVADPCVVEANGQAHMFLTVSPDGEGLATYFEINHAVANVSLAELIRTYEGVQNIPIPFPGASSPSLNFSTLASDNFVRASLGSNWTTEGSGSALCPAQIVSDVVESTVLGKNGVAFYNPMTWANDQWSRITLQQLNAVGAQIGATVRNNLGATGTFYSAIVYAPGDGVGVANQAVYLQSWLAGAFIANLAFASTITPEIGDAITCAVVGTNLFLYYNGYLILVVPDSTISSGAAGISVTPPTGTSLTNAELNGWSGGGFQSAPLLSAWSPVDSRDYFIFPNTGIVQPSGAIFYTGQTSSNAAVPGVDSRAAGAPVDSRVNVPENSRVSS